jgi:hypothetical protein
VPSGRPCGNAWACPRFLNEGGAMQPGEVIEIDEGRGRRTHARAPRGTGRPGLGHDSRRARQGADRARAARRPACGNRGRDRGAPGPPRRQPRPGLRRDDVRAHGLRTSAGRESADHRDASRASPRSPQPIAVAASPETGYRMRTRLHVRGGRLGRSGRQPTCATSRHRPGSRQDGGWSLASRTPWDGTDQWPRPSRWPRTRRDER